MNIEQERAAFEWWASDEGWFPEAVDRDSDGDYVLMQTASSWYVWQARAALQAECERLREALFEAQATMTSALPFEPVINEVTKKMLGTEVDRIKSLLSEGGNKS